MLISVILLLITFVILIILIAINKIDRSMAALGCGIFAFIVLKFIEGADFQVFAEFLIGTPSDDYTNLHAIILIFGIMIIIQICVEAGVFQFISFRLIQMTGGKPIYLLVVFCTLSFFITALINDMLAVILLIPLTITICRILDIDPIPYIISQAITIKVGCSLFLISSIPSILIATFLNLTFMDFFLDIGKTSLAIFALSLIVLIGIYRNKLKAPRQGIDLLRDYNVWTFINDKKLMIKSIVTLGAVIVCFIIIPPQILSTDIIALIGAIVLVIISSLDSTHIFKQIDFKLLIYLIGIFIMVGGLEYVGIITFIGDFVQLITPNSVYLTFVIVLWFSAFFSAFIDNITTTKMFIPAIGIVTSGYPVQERILIYSGMTYGINWGDNLTPFGDTIILINVAEQNKCHITPFNFFRIASKITIFQLCMVSILYSLYFDLMIGLLLIVIAIGIISSITIFKLINGKKIKIHRIRFRKPAFLKRNKEKKPFE